MSKSIHYVTFDCDGSIKRHTVKPTKTEWQRIWRSKGDRELDNHGIKFWHWKDLVCQIAASASDSDALLAANVMRVNHICYQPTLIEERAMLATS